MKIASKISVFLLLVSFVFNSSGIVFAATAVDLGTAGNFAVLAGSGITDTNPSVVIGDVGLSPTTGAAIGLTIGEVTGTIYAVDTFGPAGSTENAGLLTTAKDDLTAAYLDAEGQVPTTIATELGGSTTTPGVYNSASGEFGITGMVTLDAEGDPDAVFIFQAGSTLITASDSEVRLVNGAQACNVFWQVTSSATLGTSSDFKGNILALASITDDGGSIVEGRLMARTGAVTLNDTSVTKADCAVPPPPPPPPPPPSPPPEPEVVNSSSRAGDSNRPAVVAPPAIATLTPPPIATLPQVLGVTTTYTPSMPSTGGDSSSILLSLQIAFILLGAGVFLALYENRRKIGQIK